VHFRYTKKFRGRKKFVLEILLKALQRALSLILGKMSEQARDAPQDRFSQSDIYLNVDVSAEDSDDSGGNLDGSIRGSRFAIAASERFSLGDKQQSMKYRHTRKSFSVQRPARRTSFKDEDPRFSRRLNIKVPRRLSDGQRSIASGGSGKSNDSQNRSKNRSSSSAESIRSASTTHSSGDRLNEGGMSLLRRIYSRAKTSRFSEEGDAVSLMDNHETLEFFARRGDDEHGTMDTAAAQLVASGMSGSKFQSRFTTNEYVLVSLEVMNQQALPELISRDRKLRNALNGTDLADENLDSDVLKKEAELENKFSLEPLNRFGYPEGEGTKVEEQRGPYLYVLAQVKMVHFEEDARYYTVTRCDTGMDQRADSEWMVGESITSGQGLEAALQAAKMNKKVKAEQNANRSKNVNAGSGKSHIEIFIETYIIKPLSELRIFTKHQMRLMLLGLPPYSFEFKFTGVNLLVCCSILFMLLDQIRLAFAPPSWDRPIIILNAIIWFILAFELIFEILIRPKGYFAVIESEKKYNPSTARFINTFHLVTESLALIFFIPEMRCLFMPGDRCGEALAFTLLEASMKKSFGPERIDVARAVFIIGMLRLRICGLVRHFKQKVFVKNVIGEDFLKENIHKYAGNEEDTEIKNTLLQERERLIDLRANKKKKYKNMSAIVSFLFFSLIG